MGAGEVEVIAPRQLRPRSAGGSRVSGVSRKFIAPLDAAHSSQRDEFYLVAA